MARLARARGLGNRAAAEVVAHERPSSASPRPARRSAPHFRRSNPRLHRGGQDLRPGPRIECRRDRIVHRGSGVRLFETVAQQQRDGGDGTRPDWPHRARRGAEPIRARARRDRVPTRATPTAGGERARRTAASSLRCRRTCSLSAARRTSPDRRPSRIARYRRSCLEPYLGIVARDAGHGLAPQLRHLEHVRLSTDVTSRRRPRAASNATCAHAVDLGGAIPRCSPPLEP